MRGMRGTPPPRPAAPSETAQETCQGTAWSPGQCGGVAQAGGGGHRAVPMRRPSASLNSAVHCSAVARAGFPSMSFQLGRSIPEGRFLTPFGPDGGCERGGGPGADRVQQEIWRFGRCAPPLPPPTAPNRPDRQRCVRRPATMRPPCAGRWAADGAPAVLRVPARDSAAEDRAGHPRESAADVPHLAPPPLDAAWAP